MAKALPLDGEKIRFILSAGRKGSVFLANGLRHLDPQHEVVHEPVSSRRIFMAYNAERTGLLPAGTARRIFVTNRRRVLARLVAALPTGPTASAAELAWSGRANPSRARKIDAWRSRPEEARERAYGICRPPLLRFGYVDDQ